MSGNSLNAGLWASGKVLVAPMGTAGPTDVTTAWPAAYLEAGLLDGEQGFEETRSETSNDYYAWGGLLVKSTKSKQKRQIKFYALEDNEVVFALVNPGSTRATANSLVTSGIKSPTTAEFAIGFEVTDGAKVKRRYCERATVEAIGNIKESEAALTVYEITVTLYPDSNGYLYHEIKAA